MTRHLLLHSDYHGNILDTLHVNDYEIRHHQGLISKAEKKNYEILPKTLDKHHRDAIKQLKLGKFAAHDTETTAHGRQETKDGTQHPKRIRKASTKQNVSNLRKAMPALPRRHTVRHQARRPDTQVSAMYKADRQASGTRTTHQSRATSRLTTGVVENGAIYETQSQLKPRSRIGAFWLKSSKPTTTFAISNQKRRHEI